MARSCARRGSLEEGGDLYQQDGRSLPDIPGLTARTARSSHVRIADADDRSGVAAGLGVFVGPERTFRGHDGNAKMTLYPKAAFAHPEFKRISDDNFERK